jgi:hypothetical protein
VNAIGYAKFRSRSHDAVIRAYDNAGNVIETHEHANNRDNRRFAITAKPDGAFFGIAQTAAFAQK